MVYDHVTFQDPVYSVYVYVCVCVCVYMLPAACNAILKFCVLSNLKKCDTSASVTRLQTVKQCSY